MSNTDSLVVSEAELALLAMDRGRWAEAAGHLDTALAAIDEHRMHDYATSVLAFAGAARLAVHRGDLDEANRQLTQAMRARPSCTFVLPWLAVRARLQLAKVYWAIGDQTTARHLLREIDDILLHRPALGALVDEVAEFRQVVTSSAPVGGGRRVAAHPGRAAAAAVPADPPHDPRDRGAAVRLPQHRQLRGQLDLPQARRLLPRRGGGTGDGDRTARRVAGVSHAGRFEGLVDVVPERHRELRRGRDDAGQPDDGNDADQHVDDLGGGGARAHRGIGLRAVGRHSATDRDQRGQADQRQRLRIERPGPSARLGRRRLRRRARR